MAFNDPHNTPTSSATSPMVIHQLACTSSLTFKTVSAFTETEGLPLQCSSWSNSCPLLKWLYQSYTAVVLSALSPYKVYKAYSFSAVLFPRYTCTWCWFSVQTETLHQTGETHLCSSSSRTKLTGSNTQPLPRHGHKGYRQHNLQHCCHIATYFNTSPQFWKLFNTTT